MKKNFLTSLFIILCSVFIIQHSSAQSPNWLWAKGIGGTGIDSALSIAVDPSGNGDAYITGKFVATVDFDPGVGTFNLTSAGGNDIFVLKLDGSGNFVWAKQFGSTGNDVGHALAIDASGNVYTTGWFNGITDFDPNTGVFNLTSTGLNDIFISKLDSSGNFVWAKAATGSSDDAGRSIAVDGNGNCYVSGFTYSPTITFGSIMLLNAGDYDMFIAKYDASGAEVWAKSAGGNSGDGGWDIAVDAGGNIFVTGSFKSPSITFGNITLTNANSGGFYEDIYIVKYDTSGTPLWAKSAGGSTDDVGVSIAVDTSGNSYLNGYFQSASLTFGSTTLTSSGYFDMFIAKYDTGGTAVWAKAAGGSTNDNGFGITVDAGGNSYVVGSFESPTITFGSIILINALAGFWDTYIVKYDATGTEIWAKAAGGSAEDRNYGVAVDVNGRCYVTGYFQSVSITFGSTTLTNSGNMDMFIAKLDSSTINTGNIEIEYFEKGILLIPNPFSNSTTISFFLEQSDKVSLKIFDINGRLISALADKIFEEGEHQIEFNAEKINAGIYFLKMQTGEFLKTEKLIVTK